MAIVYGRPGTFVALSKKLGLTIESLKDINDELTRSRRDLSEGKKKFQESIAKHGPYLTRRKVQLEKAEDNFLLKWGKKFQEIDDQITEEKHKKGFFKKVFRVGKLKLERRRIKKAGQHKYELLKGQISRLNSQIRAFKKDPGKYHQDRYIKKYGELETHISRLEKSMVTADFAGAMGEEEVLNLLRSGLDKNHHILCDVYVHLYNYITYRGKKDLKSAQIDFVVISRAGVWAIEVKNWTKSYTQSHKGLSPHEQVGRAGRCLYIWLKQRSLPFQVSTLLVGRNQEYRKEFRRVQVQSPEGNLVFYLMRQKKRLEPDEIKRVVDMLRDRVNIR